MIVSLGTILFFHLTPFPPPVNRICTLRVPHDNRDVRNKHQADRGGMRGIPDASGDGGDDSDPEHESDSDEEAEGANHLSSASGSMHPIAKLTMELVASGCKVHRRLFRGVADHGASRVVLVL